MTPAIILCAEAVLDECRTILENAQELGIADLSDVGECDGITLQSPAATKDGVTYRLARFSFRDRASAEKVNVLFDPQGTAERAESDAMLATMRVGAKARRDAKAKPPASRTDEDKALLARARKEAKANLPTLPDLRQARAGIRVRVLADDSDRTAEQFVRGLGDGWVWVGAV